MSMKEISYVVLEAKQISKNMSTKHRTLSFIKLFSIDKTV